MNDLPTPKPSGDAAAATVTASQRDDRPAMSTAIEDLLNEAEAAVSEAQLDDRCDEREMSDDSSGLAAFRLADLQQGDSDQPPHDMALLGDVELDLRVELGRTEMTLEEVLRLRSGSVVALDKFVGDPVDIYINGSLIAHGEVLVMNDHFCIRVTKLVGGGDTAN